MVMGELDRRKHDVDVIERVIGGIRDTDGPPHSTRVIDVDVHGISGYPHSTLELTVGLDETESKSRRRY